MFKNKDVKKNHGISMDFKKTASVISIISLLDGKKLFLEQSCLLGKGSFGKVYSIKINGVESNLVCKKINLRPSRHNKRNYKFFEAINEIYGLYTCGYLVGYELKNDVLYIVMKKMEGSVLDDAIKEKSDLDVKEIYFEAFRHLKKFHRKMGYAHLDSHPGNFMISSLKPYKARLIDFSRMQPVSFGGIAMDYKNLMMYFPIHCSPIEFYLREKKEYYKKHPIAAMSDIASWFLHAFILAGMLPLLSGEEICASVKRACFTYGAAKAFNVTRSMMPNFLLPMFSPIIFLIINELWKNGLALLINQEVSIFNPWVWINVMYLFVGLSLVCRLFMEFADDYILPERFILKKMNIFFNQLHPLKENILLKAKEISEAERFLPISYAKRTGRFFTIEQHNDSPCLSTEQHRDLYPSIS
ncbi:protein kinase domain-containing protein [Legionella sp. CNM-4043-24]|uniref:protein kinase domain-containing protein n=1 Tax=Legionella sp. CNM-4043-24 TaxID=3421646 RepID=UPI00403AFB53